MGNEKENGGDEKGKCKGVSYFKLIVIFAIGIALGVVLKNVAIEKGITMGAEDYKKSEYSSDHKSEGLIEIKEVEGNNTEEVDGNHDDSEEGKKEEE